jgi:TPR repeat protein
MPDPDHCVIEALYGKGRSMSTSQRVSRGFHHFVRLFVTRTLAAVVLIVILTGAAAAGPLEDAWTAYKRGDYATALQLWRPLAEQGNVAAQANLGFMYYHGHGVPQDYGEAAKWFRLAAEQGNATAQSNLGGMYYGGQGVPQDYVQAHMWVDLAASRFPPSATEDRDQAAHHRDIVASHMTPEQIAEAQRLAREWKPK